VQPLIDWLIHELQDPAKAATGILGSTVTFLILVVYRAVRDERKRSEDEERKVRAMVVSVPPEPKVPSPVEPTLRRWSLEEDIANLRGRLGRLDAEHGALKTEQERTKLALAESRDAENATAIKLKLAEEREKKLADELATLREEIKGGHQSLDVSKSQVRLTPINVVEISDEKTPQQRNKGRLRP
jgi:hypothetical protein